MPLAEVLYFQYKVFKSNTKNYNSELPPGGVQSVAFLLCCHGSLAIVALLCSTVRRHNCSASSSKTSLRAHTLFSYLPVEHEMSEVYELRLRYLKIISVIKN